MELYLTALMALLDVRLLALLFGSVAIGICVGALPGISATMGVALASPLTFAMDPLSGILMLTGIYSGGVFGGSLSAIILGIPGTPGSVASTFDGYPMAQRGDAGLAVGIATVSSFLGGAFSALVLAVLAYPVARFALAFGPREYLALVVFALAAIASLSGGSFLKGALTGLIGMFIATIGIDETFGVSRFHYGSGFLLGGISFVPVMIGLFAIPEVLAGLRADAPRIAAKMRGRGWRLEGLTKLLPAQLRSALIGVTVGAVPGAGADIAAIVSYSQGKTWSRHRDQYGTGHPEGLASAETANNAATGGTLIPLLTLGIPGGAVAAIMLGTFMTHGLQPGPLLLERNPELVYQIFIGFLLANVALLVLGLASAGILVKVLQVPRHLLTPTILLLCIIGAFAMRNSVADVVIMIAVGLFAYLLMLLNYPRAPLALGVILGPMLEAEFARTMLVIDHWTELFTPISSVIWLLAAVPLLAPVVIARMQRQLPKPGGTVAKDGNPERDRQ